MVRLAYGDQVVICSRENHPRIVIGRGKGCDLVIEDKLASRQHCTLEARDDEFFLLDRSTNGTYVTVEGEQEILLNGQGVALATHGWIAFGHPHGGAAGAVEFSGSSKKIRKKIGVRARFSARREGQQQADQAEREEHGEKPDDDLERRDRRLLAVIPQRLVEPRIAASDLPHAGAPLELVFVAGHGPHHGPAPGCTEESEQLSQKSGSDPDFGIPISEAGRGLIARGPSLLPAPLQSHKPRCWQGVAARSIRRKH
jgi:hypothetical protein